MISEQHKKIYQDIHKTLPFGKRVKIPRHFDWFIGYTKARSICDFGCGKGRLVDTLREVYDVDVRGYDPGNLQFADSIDSIDVDLMISCDVLEHVEPEFLTDTLHYLKQRSRYIYHMIALTPAKLHLPDGRNAHLIQKPAKWWRQQFLDLDYEIIREDHTTATKTPRGTRQCVIVKHYYVMAQKR